MRLAPVFVMSAATAVLAQHWTEFDIEGVKLPGGAGHAVEYQTDQLVHGPPAFILWDITLEMNAPSWGSEFVLELEHESGYLIALDGSDDNPGDLGPADWVFGFGDTPGLWESSGAIFGPDPFPDDTIGLWTMRLYDEFDNPGIIDGVVDIAVAIAPPAPSTLATVVVGTMFTGRRRGRGTTP